MDIVIFGSVVAGVHIAIDVVILIVSAVRRKKKSKHKHTEGIHNDN